MSTPAISRGCGTRVAGGVYIECQLAPDGLPIEYFFCDPPTPVPKNLRIPYRGMGTIVINGVTHLVDHVGSQSYPNVADFIEEARRFGISRRIPKNFPFEKLSPESKILLVHDRAYIKNIQAYKTWKCPQGNPEHAPEEKPLMCAGVWWEDIKEGARKEPKTNRNEDRAIVRSMPSFTYQANRRPTGVKPQYLRAFFARFPITQITVIKGNHHQTGLKNAQKSSIPVATADK
jgi:hypothetical protein